MEDKLLFILVYQKTNPLQTMHACTWLSNPRATTDSSLAARLAIPSRASARPEWDASRSPPVPHAGGCAAGVGRYRASLQRLTDASEQTAHYSGKKKRTRIRTLLINAYKSGLSEPHGGWENARQDRGRGAPDISGQQHTRQGYGLSGL